MSRDVISTQVLIVLTLGYIIGFSMQTFLNARKWSLVVHAM